MKKVIGVLIIFLLIATLALVVTGIYKILNISNDIHYEDPDKTEEPGNENPGDENPGDENPGNGTEENPNDNPGSGTEENPNDKPDDKPVGTDPEPEIEYGTAADVVVSMDIPENERNKHMLSLEFDEIISTSAQTVKVKLYFGSFIKLDSIENAENATVELLLTNEEGDRIVIAEIPAKDFYSDKYVCVQEHVEDTVVGVRFKRVIEISVPMKFITTDKGMLTFTAVRYNKDAESGMETLEESSNAFIWFNKKDEVYELSDEKETTIIYSYEYQTDISDYIGYIEPTGDLWSDNYLLLVNPWNSIEKNEELTIDKVSQQSAMSSVKSEYNYYYLPNIKLNTTALKALTAMFKEAVESTDLEVKNLQVTSSYRNYATQESIFNSNVKKTKKYVCNDEECGFTYITKYSYSKCQKCKGAVTSVAITKEEAEENVKTYSCAPGTSEHQTGLAVDIIDTAYNLDLLEGFKDTEAGKWLAENCARFGFVLRFEEEKEDVTGIIYEPWHFRYVGRYHATRMTELDMCLEEYIEFLTEEGYFDDPTSVHNPANMTVDPETYLIVGETKK
ncbi:MAG: hypothetical protein E7633_04360 [Ruminococcaceae bacterium]|nr:hypothetical protein [Oscillospiraceae bacterium]